MLPVSHDNNLHTAHSPLFEPVHWLGEGFQILDETRLPERVEYIAVADVAQALSAVREMKTRAFGQVLTFLYSAALLAQAHDGKGAESLRARLARMTEDFCAARPTFDFRGLGGQCAAWFDKLPAETEPGKWIAGRARELAANIIRAREQRVKRAADVLPNPARVLTHCNISGELAAIARRCRELGKEISVIASETRPYLQGSRLTAWEVAQAGAPVAVIPDCAIAQVMAKGEVNAVVVGSDRCAQNGDVVNKVGTYPLALIAREFGIPFYALVQDPGSLASGADLQIEERPADELLTFQGQPLIAEGAAALAVRYPAFDVTPAHLVSALIGFDDHYTPESFRKTFRAAAAPTRARAAEKEKYLLVYGLPARSSYSYLAHALKAEQAQRVLVPEMRPELWGVQVVSRALLERNIPTTLISDNMMGTLFAQGQIQRLYLFNAGLTEKGPSAICGALLAVLLARAHRVPVELLDSEQSKFVPVDRDASTFLGRKVSAPGASIRPIEKEIIPWSLFKPAEGGGS